MRCLKCLASMDVKIVLCRNCVRLEYKCRLCGFTDFDFEQLKPMSSGGAHHTTIASAPFDEARLKLGHPARTDKDRAYDRARYHRRKHLRQAKHHE